jgi:hypothetical protein
MPQFDVAINPATGKPFPAYTGTNLVTPELPSASPYVKPKKKQGQKPASASAPASAPAAATTSPAAATAPTTTGGKTDAEKRKAAAEKRKTEREAARKAAADAAFNKYNPLMTKFQSPYEIRKQAEDLAALGAPSEESIRQLGAQQIAGIGGLTAALQGRLADVNTQNQASVAGLSQVYRDIAAQAQGAGTSAAAAAGAGGEGVAAPVAAGGTPTVVPALQAYAAQTANLAPAAGVVGAGLEAQARSGLTKSLLDRANTVSSDTAKYLNQLQQQEYQKATGIETIRQNAALLGLKKDTLAANTAYQSGRLAASNTSNQIKLMQLQRQTKADQMKFGQNSAKPVNNLLQSILTSADTIGATQNRQDPSGLRSYTVKVQDALGDMKDETVYALTPQAAVVSLGNARIVGQPIDNGVKTITVAPSKSQLLNQYGRMIVQASNGRWSLPKAQAWLIANVPNIANATG